MLSYSDLCDLVHRGVIDALPGQINGASIDVCLGSTLLLETPHDDPPLVNLAERQAPSFNRLTIPVGGYALEPGEFVLAETLETFNLPDDLAALFVLKSSMARAGLEHSQAGFADPGWHGSRLTLELKNITGHHRLLLQAGMRIGQMVFFRVKPVPGERSYARQGAYNGQAGVVASRPMVIPTANETAPKWPWGAL